VSTEARYEILEKLGSGSFATVYRARDKELGREVAIKQIHQEFVEDPQKLSRYWQEAQLLASLHHPNIVTIFDIVRQRGWLVMELMQGNLHQRMQGRPMDLRAVRSTLGHGLRALKYLHAQGITHGDVKPGNLMLDARKRIKLGDFGLARRASNATGSLVKGTTKYMAPEVVSDDFGEVGPASDLYSLGFSAYELMCGDRFDELFPGLNAFGRNPQLAWMMWHATPDRRLPEISRVLQGVPEDLRHVIEKLTQKDQALRYQTADQALSDLNIDLKLVGGGEEEASGEPRETKRIALAGAALAVSLLMSGAMLFWPTGATGPETVAGEKSLGIVKQVLADQNRLVIQDLETGELEELTIGRKQKIYLMNEKQNILLRDLQQGDHVALELDQTEPTLIHGIVVDRPVANRGFIRELHLGDRRIVVGLQEGNLQDEFPIRVPEAAQLSLNGQSVPLRDLHVGDEVQLTHVAEPGERKGRLLEVLSARRRVTLIGYVQAYLPDEKELAIELNRSASKSLIRLPVAETCAVTINGTAAPQGAADLKAGDRVVLEHDNAIHEVTATRNEQLEGVVFSLDPAQGSLLISLANGDRKTLQVQPSTEITLSLEPVKLEDLRRFDQVRSTFQAEGGMQNALTIDARRPPQTDRWALVIGTQSYDDSSLSAVPTALNDARAIHTAFLKRYAVTDQRGPLLLDAPLATWRERIREVCASANAGTQLIICLAGHAYANEDGQVFLAPRDFDLGDMDKTGLSMSELAELMNASAANEQILLLDVSPQSQGRAADRQVAGDNLLKNLSPGFQKATVILACQEGQHSVVDRVHHRGIFAKQVAEAFQGAADAERDLHISADDLFAHLVATVPAAATDNGGQQTPQLVKPRPRP